MKPAATNPLLPLHFTTVVPRSGAAEDRLRRVRDGKQGALRAGAPLPARAALQEHPVPEDIPAAAAAPGGRAGVRRDMRHVQEQGE